MPVSEKMATMTIIEKRRRSVSESIQEAMSEIEGLSSRAARIATDIVAASIAARVRWTICRTEGIIAGT